MNYYSKPITNLIDELKRLPGIGGKSAQRLAFHIINMPEEHVEHLASALVEARTYRSPLRRPRTRGRL